MDNIQLARKIRKLCKLKNITVKSLLDNCGINKNFIYELEKRGKVPSVDTVTKIADYLDIPVDYLLSRYEYAKFYQERYCNISIVYPKYVNQDAENDINQDTEDYGTYTLSKQEAELVGLYRMLSAEDRAKLISSMFDLEDNLQKMQ